MSTHEEVVEWLEERQGRFIGIADQIWEHPELALAEHKACKLQSDDLAADGFTITGNIGDMPTAFMAEWSQGEGGPVIGFLGEYDALPGLSQENQQAQAPIVVDGPGHGCGHNLLGTAALASASVIKSWLEHTGTAGTVLLDPAESWKVHPDRAAQPLLRLPDDRNGRSGCRDRPDQRLARQLRGKRREKRGMLRR